MEKEPLHAVSIEGARYYFTGREWHFFITANKMFRSLIYMGIVKDSKGLWMLSLKDHAIDCAHRYGKLE